MRGQRGRWAGGGPPDPGAPCAAGNRPPAPPCLPRPRAPTARCCPGCRPPAAGAQHHAGGIVVTSMCHPCVTQHFVLPCRQDVMLAFPVLPVAYLTRRASRQASDIARDQQQISMAELALSRVWSINLGGVLRRAVLCFAVADQAAASPAGPEPSRLRQRWLLHSCPGRPSR